MTGLTAARRPPAAARPLAIAAGGTPPYTDPTHARRHSCPSAAAARRGPRKCSWAASSPTAPRARCTPVATVDLGALGALFLNDIAAAPDRSLYLTDTSVRLDTAGTRTHTGPDRVFRIRGREATAVLEGEFLNQPNGILWEPARRRFLIAPITGTALLAWAGPGARPESIAAGAGRYDGIEVMADGRVLVSAWIDSTVSVVDGDRIRPVIRGVPAPADIGLDSRAGIVAVPLLLDGRVEFWRLGAR